MEKCVIDIIGFAGSGKSQLCEYIVKKYGFELYRPSDALRAYAREHDRELNNRQDYIDIHHEIIAHDPLAIIAPVFRSTAPRICLDGMRAPIPFLELKERFDAQLVYLDCPAEERLARIQSDTSRSGHRVAMSLAALQADEAPDLHNPNRNLPNMDEMRSLADFIIDASQPKDAVMRQADDILAKLLA